MKNRYDQYSYDPPTPKNQIVDWLNGQMSNEVDSDGDPIGHDHDPNAPGRGGQIKAGYIANEPNNGLSSNNVQGAIDELKGLVDLGRIHVPIRQTVLQGKFDYNTRQPVFISEVPGQLKLNLWATEVPLICTVCDGFDALGQKDYVFALTQDVPEAWTLPANKPFLQLYIEYNPTTKTASFGYTEVLFTWDYPAAPIVDTHWCDKNNRWIMQHWNGSTWETKYRLMIGECSTGTNTIENVICYAIRGEYDSGWFLINTNQNYDKLAALGITGILPNMTCYFREESTGRIINQANYGERDAQGWYTCGIVMVNRNVLRLFTSDLARLCFARGGQGGEAVTPNGSNVSARIIANRGF